MVALLAAVGDSDQHTQRSLAGRLDVALGLANALLKRCVSKGLIKIHPSFFDPLSDEELKLWYGE